LKQVYKLLLPMMLEPVLPHSRLHCESCPYVNLPYACQHTNCNNHTML